jgi:hypothetical protein
VTGADERPSTERLRREQDRKETQELERLERAEEPAEADQAARRADKAAYLKEKLREQEDADVD